MRGSNSRPSAYEADAITTMLNRQSNVECIFDFQHLQLLCVWCANNKIYKTWLQLQLHKWKVILSVNKRAACLCTTSCLFSSSFFFPSYLLGLLAKIKCSICSSQPDIWDCSQRELLKFIRNIYVATPSVHNLVQCLFFFLWKKNNIVWLATPLHFKISVQKKKTWSWYCSTSSDCEHLLVRTTNFTSTK